MLDQRPDRQKLPGACRQEQRYPCAYPDDDQMREASCHMAKECPKNGPQFVQQRRTFRKGNGTIPTAVTGWRCERRRKEPSAVCSAETARLRAHTTIAQDFDGSEAAASGFRRSYANNGTISVPCTRSKEESNGSGQPFQRIRVATCMKARGRRQPEQSTILDSVISP